MAVPVATLQVALDDDPWTASPSWTTLTTYVLNRGGLNTNRGRSTELDSFQAGTCAFDFINRDRRFDPDYSSGSYYGKLTPGKQLRLYATYGGIDYPMFRGFVQGFPQSYALGGDSWVTINAVDAFGQLARTKLADPMLAYLVSLGATNFYRQADTGTWVDAIAGTDAALTGGTGEIASSPLAPGLMSTSVLYNNANWGHAPVTGTGLATGVSFWLKTTTIGPSSTNWRSLFGNESNISPNFRIGIDSSGLIRYSGFDYLAVGTKPSGQSTRAVTDGQPHHVVVTQGDIGDGYAVKIFIDGVDYTGTTVPNAGKMLLQWIGSAMASTSDQNYVGELQDVAYAPVFITQAQARTIYQLGYGNFLQDCDDRAQSVLTAIGWPSGLTQLSSTTRGQCLGTFNAGQSALAHLQLVEATEQGRLFVDASGKVTLHERYYTQEQTRGNTSQATFSDDGADILYSAYGTDHSVREVQNDITVTCTGGGTANCQDATSIADNGYGSNSITTLLPTVKLADDMARGLVYMRKNPQVRAKQITVYPQHPNQPVDVWAKCFGLEIGDRITHEITPNKVGSQTVRQLIVEQIGWELQDGRWTFTVQGSPVPPKFFQLGVSELDGPDVLGF